ncbi:hypothetical protein GA0074704_3127 [Micromonospora siamensis]|uniref:Uncharacterized protein n=1 Tax=Micromonospora siamensis TaxID=299152 RepID=A0A1C5I9P0_9ACTN|nr:hypothetical protein GA0074704_3127 [Micromonospora siamensis]
MPRRGPIADATRGPDSSRPAPTLAALAAATSALTPVSWAGTLFGGWLLTAGPVGSGSGEAAGWEPWLVVTGPVALLLTATAAVTLRCRGASGPASVFGAVALAGVAGAALWRW